ncbi:hypothetical protein CTAYLR_000544 [Chrysophaeum taylorii]|uniref:non-specific serine/threonine protein kinase n=1 Tax=Chrysophaeum taylorii TaxID=2483200 RepID=A0AAD7XNE7_9STRA|nr:hypothetical protein CTAYLR_000544 [Chrysophaeum taylorii]
MFYEFNPSDPDNRERASLLGRGALLAGLNHPNIVGYITSFEHGGEFFVVMEYVGGGHLGFQIGKSHDLKTLRRWALQIFGALDYNHGRHLLHRDLEPENIHVVVGGSSVKLADFGLAAPMVTMGLSTHVGTFNYVSPQKASNNQRHDAADDMWGSGCVLGELLTGTRLHERCPRMPFCNDARAIKDVCTQSREADGVLGLIVRDLLVTVPAQRSSAAEAAARLEGGGGGISERLPQVSEEPNQGDEEAERRRCERVARAQQEQQEEAARRAGEQKRREEAERKALPSHGASKRFLLSCKMTWRRILERLETDDRDLKEVDLSHCKIDDQYAARLAESLEKNTSRRSLSLRENGIGAEGAARLAESLKQNTSLQTLYIHCV